MRLYGFAFKWQDGRIRRAVRREFLQAYPQAELSVVNQGNFEAFVTPQT